MGRDSTNHADYLTLASQLKWDKIISSTSLLEGFVEAQTSHPEARL